MREINVFISSPGDVAEERIIASRVIERLGHRFAGRAQLRSCFWEHLPLRASEHFQPQIPKPSKFDVVVMMLWSRIGTRLPEELQRADGSRYDSGTEFEFEDAVAGLRAHGLPHLLVYRKTASLMVELTSNEDSLVEISRQKKSVDRFIDRWFRSTDSTFKAAFHEFGTIAAFEEQLDHHLRTLFEEMLGSGTGPDGRFIAPAVEWHPQQQGSPFRGLKRFDYEHRAIYFGRTKAINEVLDMLRRQAAAGCPFVLVFGTSGVGKSSFLRAGVLPFLVEPGVMDGVGVWRYAIFEPSDSTGDLLDGLAAALLTDTALPGLAALLAGREATDSEREAKLAAMLRKSPDAVVPLVRSQLNALADECQRARPVEVPLDARLALLIDPLEEIFTRHGSTPEDREGFLLAINALARSKLVWALGSMRSDFYEKCAEHPALLDLKSGNGQYHLAPPTSAEIGRMIRLPAQLAGLQFEEHPEDGPLDEVLRDAASGDPGALPVLQFTLDEIYQRGDAATTGRLTFATYHALGGLNGAVRTRAEETLAEVAKPLGMRLDTVFSAVFSALVGFKDETGQRSVRLYSPLDRLVADPDRKMLVDAFIGARLFMTDIDDEQRPVVTVSHETLLLHWPRLASWIEANHDFLRARNRVTAAATRWREEGRDTAFLLAEGKPLAEGRDLLEKHRAEIEPPEVEFLESSLAHADDRRRRERRRTRIVVTSVGTLAVLAAILAAVSVVKAREAADKTREAEASLETAEYRRIIATNAYNSASDARDESELRADESETLAQLLFDDIGARLQPSDPQNRRLVALITKATLAHYGSQPIEREPPARKAEQVRNLLKVTRNLERMGRFREALAFGERIRAMLGSIPSITAASSGETYELIARCQNQIGKYEDAETSFKAALALAPTASDARRVNEALGELYRHVGRYSESERLLSLEPGAVASVSRLRALGELFRYLDRLPEAEQRLGEAAQLAEAASGRLAKSRDDLYEQRRKAQSVEDVQRLDAELGELQPKLEKADDDVMKVRSDLGVLRYDQHRDEEAERFLREALAADIKSKGNEHPLVAADQYKLARVLIRRGLFPQTEEMLGECRQTLAITLGSEPNQRMAKCLEALAALRAAERRFPEAIEAAGQVLAMRNAIFKPPHPEIIKALAQLAEILETSGEHDRSSTLHAQSAAMKVAHQAREAAIQRADAQR